MPSAASPRTAHVPTTEVVNPYPWVLDSLPVVASVAFATVVSLRHDGRPTGIAMLLGPWAGLPLGHSD